MNKAAIEKFAIDARNDLIAGVKQRAYQFGIEQGNYGEDAVSAHGHVFSGEEMLQREQLIRQIQSNGYEKTMEEVAYTWFNRFIALRFMEVNNYLPTHIRVFSDANGAFKPEILQEALRLEPDTFSGLDKQKIAEYLEKNQTEDLYRYLLLMQCNALHPLLPVMFDTLKGYMALLLPNNILKSGSVLARLVEDIAEEDFKGDVEIIGWMYQYYITELNQMVYDGSFSKSKVSKELLPAATTFYTPDWVIRYMVENSLGKLWLEANPNDEIKSNWKYYLEDAEQTVELQEQYDLLKTEKSVKLEEIKVIDPCMGSGHILVYIFDVLMQIYESQGYASRDAVAFILQNNLFGLDIDERAYQLAYFSVMMQARKYDRRFLTRGIYPQVYCPKGYTDGEELGSILIINELEDKPQSQKNLPLLRPEQNLKVNTWNFRRLLYQKYDVVVTNPPYLGNSRFNAILDAYVKENFEDVKSDLSMVMFKHAIDNLCQENGYVSFVTTSSWLSLTSFEKIRIHVLKNYNFVSIVDFGTELFEGKIGHNPIVAWVNKKANQNLNFIAIKLSKYCYSRRHEKKDEFFNKRNYYVTKKDNFYKIPCYPFSSYWASKKILSAFKNKNLGEIAKPRQGLATSDNNRFLRLWFEIEQNKFGFLATEIAQDGCYSSKWFPYNKGGNFRRWYGNNDFVINYEDDGYEVKEYAKKLYKSHSRTIKNIQYYFKECISWSLRSDNNVAFRYIPSGYIFDVAGMCCFSENNLKYLLALCNSKVSYQILSIITPTVNKQAGHIACIPVIFAEIDYVEKITKANIGLCKSDWDAFETSWDFIRHPLLNYGVSLASGLGDDYSKAIDLTVEKTDNTFFILEKGQPRNISLQSAFELWQKIAEKSFDTLKANEEELNRIFIDIYGLQDELTPEVEGKDVTVRLADKVRDIKSFISYAVGCMFGRYSLDVGGLAYAGGDWDTSKYVSFMPDADNIIPICDDEYFDDDVTGRFVSFVEKVFGKNTLDANLQFIADALGGTGLPKDIIRNYFLNGFYADHCKIYQKRPIYWQFESGKKNGFKALMYMHRYQPDLMARMRTDYVHEQQERYDTQLVQIAENIEKTTGAERVKLGKLQKKLQEQSQEIASFEEKVHHLADQHIAIDLDDGVKHNYEFFKTVVTKIK